jgi:hypothetical protein
MLTTGRRLDRGVDSDVRTLGFGAHAPNVARTHTPRLSPKGGGSGVIFLVYRIAYPTHSP